MEKIDPQLAAKVWQRVRGTEAAEASVPVQTMVAWEKEAETHFQWLLKQLPEKSYSLQQLISDTRRHIACLQGIRQLNGEKLGAYGVGKLSAGEIKSVLRKCYGQCLKVGALYAARTEDPQYGAAFSDMARTKRRHCALILEILGSL